MDRERSTTGRGAASSESAEWAEGLLAQTRALLEKVDAGEVVIAPEHVTNLRQTERDLTELLRTTAR